MSFSLRIVFGANGEACVGHAFLSNRLPSGKRLVHQAQISNDKWGTRRGLTGKAYACSLVSAKPNLNMES